MLDKFQYAVSSSPGLLSTLQVLWDTHLSRTRVFIVLSGSIVSFAEGVLSSRNPLYGRLTGAMKLEPLKPLEVRCFVPRWSPEEAVGLYRVFGGVPGYLVEVDPGDSL